MYLRELFNKYLRWSRSRAKVTAPSPAKYPGSETLLQGLYCNGQCCGAGAGENEPAPGCCCVTKGF